MELRNFFQEHPKAALAFSGGVDSAYLLWAAMESGARVRPIFVKTPFQPDFELADARRLCGALGADLRVLEAELPPSVLANPADRCNHCKHVLFGLLWQAAKEEGYDLLLDGTNASDDPADRPGMKALAELQVLSPLRLCGLTKTEIRERSRAAGLFTWDKPAYACLATRFPAGTEITEAGLSKVEQAENLLFSLGFSDFRVRYFAGAARIQVPLAQMERLLAQRETICVALQPHFRGVFLDLEGRP